MGFEKEVIEKCMRLAYNHPDRTAEYLMGGIPEGLEAQYEKQQKIKKEQKDKPKEQKNTQPTQSNSQLKQVLQNYPQFNQLRVAIQQNPNLLQPLLARIGQDHPELMELIQQNPEEFARLLNEPVQYQQEQETEQTHTQNTQQQRRAPPGTIMVTPQEKESIDRIISMGFDRMLVIQVYFACEKNEESTVEFLISMMEKESQEFKEEKSGEKRR